MFMRKTMLKYLCAAALLITNSVIFASVLMPTIQTSYHSPGVIFQSKISLSNPTVAVLVNNSVRMTDVLLIKFDNMILVYRPSIRQVLAENIGNSVNYYISYTIKGNTYHLGNLPYTSVPAPTPDALPIVVKPGQTIYFTLDTKYNSKYDVYNYNAKMIWEDMTISDGAGHYFQCNKNNQHVTASPKDINRISLSCFSLSDS